MDAAPSQPEPSKGPRVVQALVLLVGLVLFVVYTFYCGRPTDFWFEEILQGTLTAAEVDTIASAFVTNQDVRIITPEGTRTYTPDETAALQIDVHGLLDPLVGRDSMGRVRTYVDDDLGECRADFGDTRVELTLLPTDIGHAITTLEVSPR